MFQWGLFEYLNKKHLLYKTHADSTVTTNSPSQFYNISQIAVSTFTNTCFTGYKTIKGLKKKQSQINAKCRFNATFHCEVILLHSLATFTMSTLIKLIWKGQEYNASLTAIMTGPCCMCWHDVVLGLVLQAEMQSTEASYGITWAAFQRRATLGADDNSKLLQSVIDQKLIANWGSKN